MDYCKIILATVRTRPKCHAYKKYLLSNQGQWRKGRLYQMLNEREQQTESPRFSKDKHRKLYRAHMRVCVR